MTNSQSADIVVVGAGTAGSVVVRRLVDAGHRVAVIEAGPTDGRPEIDSPFGAAALFASEVDWALSTVPQSHANGRVLYQPRGRSLGGSTILNGMLYIRGARSDYDAWAAAGATGWSWQEVEPYFRRLENYDGPTDGARGTRGPLPVHRHIDPDPLVTAFVDAAVQAGHPRNDDYNTGDSRGASYAQATVEQGARVTAWRSYVQPVADSPLLRVITDALVTKIVIDNGRAAGVEYVQDGVRHVIRAEKEVVLSAGVFGTPQLLMLSGIGAADELRQHGIEVVRDLPGVGRNLRDHVASPIVWESRRTVPTPRMTGIEAQLITDSPDAGALQPDRQAVFVSFVYSTITENLPEQGFTALAILLHPHSHGQVRLRSANPTDALLIDPGILSDPRDAEALVDHLESLRNLAGQPALAEWIKSEVYPGPSRVNRDALRDYVQASADSGHHQVGTARIGTDPLAVVDPQLLVHGLTGLRIADASVMPTTPAGNTAAPTLMIGERAADLILGTH
ncbi:GMC family oxidoreductase N-terminal domain-containing protein [Micromonospora inaquosa]|uniref:Choline dehydrogenase n=1 Tax=Micromonospora inaquosa TaxID=2203716 RepID=A0A3N9WS38_9ACTN|nr:GMC family oxidoreductase N-terminal domain-containing protein [Micromonospora inaquosa]RQX03652.1 choline dehydrogenase [Micromonospora inaquosa]